MAEEYEAAIASGIIIHETHHGAWRSPPAPEIIQQYELQYRNSVLRHGSQPSHTDVEPLIPDYQSPLNSTWNAAVFKNLANTLHSAVLAGDWDEAVEGLSVVRHHSDPNYLLETMEPRFYRFRDQWKHQRPIQATNEAERLRLIRERSELITRKSNGRALRDRRSGRKATVILSLYSAIINLKPV